MFNLQSVPSVNIKLGNYGDIDIINPSLTNTHTIWLLNKGIRWMMLNTHTNREIKEFYASYDLAYGDVIISGLGFGILSSWLASKPEVKSVKVIEISKDIVDIYLQNNTLPEKVSIEVADISAYKTSQKYDCLFLDHYETQHTDWVFKDIKNIVKNIPNHDVFWFWSLEEHYTRSCYGLEQEQLNGTFLYFNTFDFFTKWEEFKTEILPVNTLPSISSTQINNYIYTYYDRIGYGSIINQ